MTGTWTEIDLTAPEELIQVSSALERAPLNSQATLRGDPRWIMAQSNNKERRARIYAFRERNEIVGLAAFFVHPSNWELGLGELTLFSRPVCRFDAFAAPIVDAGGDRAREMSILADLFSQLRIALERDQVIFVESVQEGTAMFDLVMQPGLLKGRFHVLQHGRLYRHHVAVIPDSFESYVKLLSARTRADLRNTRKRFIAAVKGHYHTRCFRDLSEVKQFIVDAAGLSKKTYQHNILGAGLRDEALLERRYIDAAEQGWFRSYILYACEKAVAFQVGYVYNGRFYANEIGYDPDWASHHVGIFLHTEIIGDLTAMNGAVKEFDFGNGDMLHKRRLGTGSTTEGYFYLIPSHFRGSVMAVSMRVASKLSSVLGRFLDLFGVRSKVRNHLRRLGVMK
jgi:hypothetical protein